MENKGQWKTNCFGGKTFYTLESSLWSQAGSSLVGRLMVIWPRVPYLIGGSGSPAPTCCDGIKNIKGMASTTTDKRATCNCVKQAANHYLNLKDDAAQSLAVKCGVQMDIPVSRTTNCGM
ncbi:hypothetical protein ACSBR2_017026 [Camellia fascicularis]